MAAENTLLFSASAHSTHPRFYLQESWPFKNKWWRSWSWISLFILFISVFLHLTSSFPSFFHTIEFLSMLGLKANSSPLCTLFHITFKSSAGLARAPRLLASVQRFASEVLICDAQMTWARSLLVAVQTLLQTKACNVLCDVTGNQHHHQQTVSQHAMECRYFG